MLFRALVGSLPYEGTVRWAPGVRLGYALGLRYLGVLLMGSMIIIPAATARRLARNRSGMFAWAIAVAVASTVIGTGLALAVGRTPGSVIVCVAAALFLASLVTRRT